MYDIRPYKNNCLVPVTCWKKSWVGRSGKCFILEKKFKVTENIEWQIWPPFAENRLSALPCIECRLILTIGYDRGLYDFYHMSVICEKLKKKMCKLIVKVSK